MATDNLNGGNSSASSNGDSVLKDSPWGRLSEVTSLDNVSAGFASATGNQSGGAANSSGDSPYGGNPFANFGNPNASGNVFTGGTNPWASLNNSGGNGNTGSSPVGGADTSGGTAGGFGGGSTSSSGSGNSFGADTSGGSTGGFGGGSTSSSGSGNFGGIDFGSASQSVSFQDRVAIDQLVNSSLSENGVSVPTSNGGFIGNFSGDSPVGSGNSNSGSTVSGGNSGGSSNDGNSVFAGSSENTQGYSDQVAYYQGFGSQFQQNPQEATNGLVGDNQFGGGSNPFGSGSSNPFGGGSSFGA